MQRSIRTTAWVALAAAGALTLTACGGGGFDSGSEDTAAAGSGELNILIGSSGDAETDAVKAAVAAWSADSGTKATVNVASDLNQELSQGFASGAPADVFYADTEHFQGYAANGSLLAYADKLANVDDFYPTLVDTYTYDGKFVCAPKDFSTLALEINTDAWAAAGLTDADIPTTWDQLAAVSAKLTTPTQVGLAFGGEYARIGAFLAQAGGGLVSDDGKTATVNSDENLEALTWVKDQLNTGNVQYASGVGAGWGGEAFGTGKSAMTIEGNWIAGAMTTDYPDVKYTVVELPAGPGGQGTMQFTTCWGIAADSANQDAAVSLVEYLTATDQQLGFAKGFGVMPSVKSAADGFLAEFPEKEAFIKGADYAQGVVAAKGASDVITDFNAQLEGLATGDPKAILDSVQTNLQAALDANAK